MKKKAISYLSHLRFDPKLFNSYQAKYVTQVRLVILLILSIIAIGIFSYLNIPRRLNPEIKIPIVIVSTVLPGASPEDVESLLTIPLEDKINDVKDIDTMTSTSLESASSIAIQFLSTKDADKAKDEVQAAVDSVTDLPEDVKTPTVTLLDFENQPIWTFVVITKSDPVSLTRFAKELNNRIEDAPKVDKVTTSGLDEQVIEVVIRPERMGEYGISPVQVSQAVQKFAASYPAGSVYTSSSSFVLSIDREIITLDDIRSLYLSINNQPIRLGDIASISYRSKESLPQTYLASPIQPPTKTVQFFVFKASNANIDDAEQDAKKIVEETIKEYNNRFEVVTIENTAEEIVTQFNHLARDFLSTVLLVFVLLFIFLGLRQAVIASITVPLTFLSAFAIIYALGLTLNFLTAFAFLIALGLLIDDTIVVVAAMTRYYATGKFTPAQTGILVWKDFIVPLWSTTITTIWAFVPLLLASGIIGEFIKSIPIVVTATMLSSTTIAVLITLPLMIIFLKPVFPRRVKVFLLVLGFVAILVGAALLLPRNPVTILIVGLFAVLLLSVFRYRSKFATSFGRFIHRYQFTRPLPKALSHISDHGILDIEWLSHRYMRVIERVLDSRHGKRNTIIALSVFALCGYLLIPLGLVTNEFFPKQDVNLLYISVSLPSGTNIATTNKEALIVLNRVKNMPNVNYSIAESAQKFSGGMGRANDQNGFLITLHLVDKDERIITSSEIAEQIRIKLKDYTAGTLSVVELSGGPPAGADVQITLLGDDLTVLDSYATRIVEFLKKQKGVTNVDTSIKPGTSKLIFVPDKAKLAEQGLTVDTAALWIRTYAAGFTLDSLKFTTDDEEDIVLRLSTTSQTPQAIGSLMIPTQRGFVPLLALGKLRLGTNPTVIAREAGKRTIQVTASIVKGYSVTEENQKLEKFANSTKLPSGYSWKTGGVNEENQKSINSILQAMLLSMLLILITMVIEFRSFRQTIIALLIIPLSVAGVMYVFALSATPLSFPALIGILALFGIVVTHAIVVIEKINDNIRENMPLREAIIDAAGNRLEPVLLTSLATIVGLIPITLSDPLWRGLGGAIIAGLLFSGAIKLFFVPVMYYLWFKEPEKRIIRKRTDNIAL